MFFRSLLNGVFQGLWLFLKKENKTLFIWFAEIAVFNHKTSPTPHLSLETVLWALITPPPDGWYLVAPPWRVSSICYRQSSAHCCGV